MNRMQKAESDVRYLTSELKDKVTQRQNFVLIYFLILDTTCRGSGRESSSL
jgi:hypothetical protein